ncbi:heterokaryon incompatibility protein-domain-containing protein [Aspergillus cavernicola]|uniref:Heterokaryon incompatibility protein-domain-containing protein n=1 Tax=Aspergillus cavernicola TaxID=176166 RepID=A0ABR4HR50_9EURO
MSTTWMLPRGLFFNSLRQSHFTVPVSSEFLTSPAFNFVNPRHHVVATDKVTQKIPAAAIAGLSDEKVLSLFTRGFFSGFIFGFERWILWIGGYNILPARYTGAKPAPRPSVVGWNIQPGIGSDTCTQFNLVLSDEQSINFHSPAPLKVLKHTDQGSIYTTITNATFQLEDNNILSIILNADDGTEWKTSMTILSDRLIVPAQQEQLAELVIALSESCDGGEGGLLPVSPAYLQLSPAAAGLEARICAAPFCCVGGLVYTHIGAEESELDEELKCPDATEFPTALSYTANEQLWVDNAPQSSATMTDMLTSLAEQETVCIADTCRALVEEHRGILLSDMILWWEEEITEEVPKRKHPKPGNWGGFQDIWRNHKNLRESKKRAKLNISVYSDAPAVHDSVVKFAQAAKPDSNAINPLRLVHVQTGDVLITQGLEKKRYAVISYTWSQFSKEELLEWATSRAAKLGYEYIWIDQYCIDQTNKAEKNAEIKRMRDYYKSAAQVLVLLPDVTSLVSFNVVSTDQLMHVDGALNASREVLKEVLSCEWLKRVWTFQEAWVARQCVLCTREQMLDGTMMDALIGLRKYEAVSRPRVMCVGSKAIGNPVVTNPNTVVWEGSLRQRQTVVGSTERWMLQNGLNEYEPPRLTLIQAWEASRGRNTMNEEDRVYALLSSVEGGDRVKVNRGRSLQDVIQDCVEAGIVTADLLAGISPSTEPDRSWMPDLTGLGPQHPFRVAGASQIQQPLVWQGGRVSVKGKYFHFADVTAWFRIAEMKVENVMQQSEVSDRHWAQYVATERQNSWTTADIVGYDFFLVQPMPGASQTVLISGKKQSDGSIHRKKGHVIWLKQTGVEWLQDSEEIEVGTSLLG